MKLELNNRARVMLGVVGLVGALAAAWFLYLEEMIMGSPAPAPMAVAPKPAAAPAKPGAEPAKPNAQPAAAASAKPAAAGAKPAAGGPEEIIAAVLDASGARANIAKFGSGFGASAMSGVPNAAEADVKAAITVGERIFEPRVLAAEVAANLRKTYDADRMAKFLEMLKDPVNVKMVAHESRTPDPNEAKQFLAEYDRNRPSPERARLVARIDNVTKATEVATEISLSIARATADRMLAEMQKAGMEIPQSARQQIANELLLQRDKMRSEFFKQLHFVYKGVPDAELEQYVKLIDTDIGRWGAQAINNAMRPALENRGKVFAGELLQIAMAAQANSRAAAKPAAQPVAAVEKPAAEAEAPAAADQKPAAEPARVAAAPRTPPEPPAYRRPENLPELYSRYNDLITAVVMRDHAAAKELLHDGKNPNARQSDGQTALMVAAGNGDLEMVQMLLARGADPSLRGPQGVTALSIAREVRRADLVKVLEGHGVK